MVKPFTWLKIYCDEQQLENDIFTDTTDSSLFLNEKTAIYISLPAFDLAGKHIIRAVAYISDKKYGSALDLFVDI